MSGRHRKQRRNSGHGRHTPKGVRPDHLQALPLPESEDDLLRGLIEEAVQNATREGDSAFHSLLWGSHQLAMFANARREMLMNPEIDKDDIPPMEEIFLAGCLQYPSPGTQVCASALALTGDEKVRKIALSVQEELQQLGIDRPSWFTRIDELEIMSVLSHRDVWGDQESLLFTFSDVDGVAFLPLAVLIDHQAGGQAKDAWFAADAEQTREAFINASREQEAMIASDISTDTGLERLQNAMSMSRLFNGDIDWRTEDFAEFEEAIWAILRIFGRDSETDQVVVDEETQTAVVEEFLNSDQARGLDNTNEIRMVVEGIVRLRSDYEGRPLRWSPNTAHRLLLDLAPRKLMLDVNSIRALPTVLKAYVAWSCAKTGLADQFVTPIFETIDESAPIFRHAMRQQSAMGPGKIIASLIEREGIDVTDQAAMQALMNRINSSPGGIDSSGLLAFGAQRRNSVKPNEALPVSDEEINAVVMLDRINKFALFYEKPRPLTKTGNPTLADARALIEALELPDVMDQTIHDKTFKTQSAGDLPALSLVALLAHKCGAVRKQNGKLSATKKWQEMSTPNRYLVMCNNMLEEGFATLLYRDHYGFLQAFAENVDEVIPRLLQELCTKGPIEFDIAARDAADAVVAADWDLSPFLKKNQAESASSIFARTCSLLQECGIVERIDYTTQPAEYSYLHDVKSGGTLRALPLGEWWWGEAKEGKMGPEPA